MEDQPRQRRQAAATQELRDLSSSTRGPSTAQVLRVVMLILLSGVLLLLAGLALAGTLIGLAVTAPLFVLFSPVLITVALTIGLVVTGFLMSAAFVLMALFFFMRMNSLWTRMREQCTISGGERRDSGPSASVDNGNGKSVVTVDRQQQLTENNYYVFLSFRGTDTRRGFTDHLYRRLKDVGLRFHPNFVFRDDEELPYGEELHANIISAITYSKVSIPIISKDYAASQWCLIELTRIMECKESRGQIVLPVLYKVETKDVKYLKGSVKEALESRTSWLNEAVKKQGVEALRKVAKCRVYESENFADGHEGRLVDELVATVMRKQQEDFQPCLPKNLVGNDDDVDRVMKLVDTAYLDTRIIGIYGIGGIGKTTLAMIIYEKLVDKFDCRSFLRDVGEQIKGNGIEHVQSQLISHILNKPGYQVLDSDIGIRMIETTCTRKKVLILLDDVDEQDHLEKLIGDGKFMQGSRIIITCRDEATLKPEYYKHKCEGLNPSYSFRLFNIHAFEGKPPPKELAGLSREIVGITGGLPLALKVMGSLLKHTRDPKIWEEYRDKWGKALESKVMNKLKISYEILDKYTKQIFLDIACFFIGTDHRIATYLWSDPNLYPISGLQRMMELSLITYDDNNELRMHDQLRDLGKGIACPENMKRWDCSRLWDEETTEVLGRQEENENIEALRLDERGSREFMEQESFRKMPNLKYLHVKDVDFDKNFERSLAKLRWLKWERCHNSFKETKIYLEKLIVLDLSGGDIDENWRGWSSIEMERLKVLNLSQCLELKSTPNLSMFKNLEMLILEHCACLKKIHASIGDVKLLISLNLSNCGSLEQLPQQLGELENLEELVIDKTRIQEIPPCIGSLKKLKRLNASGGWSWNKGPSSKIHSPSSLLLRQIPSSIGELKELVELDLSFTNIKELPKSIEELNKLKILRIFCSNIKRLPSSIGNLQSLQELDADNCLDLEGQIHADEGGLSHLKTLRLYRTRISGLPKNLHQLYSLEYLDLLFCNLQSLPKPPFSLSTLRLTCRSNELPSLSHLNHLQNFILRFCMSLQSIPELPSCIRELDVWGCPELERLPNLSNLEFLSTLSLIECDRLKKLDGLEALKSLRELCLKLDFEAKEDNLHEIQGLEKLGSLEVVDISRRKHIQLLDLSKSKHLKQLNVTDCKSLVEIRCPSKFLDLFDWRGCESLEKIPYFLPREDYLRFWGPVIW